MFRNPKVTATSVSEMAKAAIAHFGSTTCPVTQVLSESRADRSETACHDTFFGRDFFNFVLSVVCFSF